MRRELRHALGLVLGDLRSEVALRPEVRDESWSDLPGYASCYLYAADGTGVGVQIAVDQPAHVQIAALADQIQDWAVEELCSVGRPAVWPPCPRHPASHPLAAVVDNERAVWRCPRSGRAMADIGALGQDFLTDTR
jgi:hypothetical protein